MHLDLHIRCVLYLSVSAVFAVVHRNDTADFLGERKISFSSLSCWRELYYTLIYFKLSWGWSGLCELFLLTEFTRWFFFLFFSVWVFKKLLLTEKRGKGFMQTWEKYAGKVLLIRIRHCSGWWGICRCLLRHTEASQAPPAGWDSSSLLFYSSSRVFLLASPQLG